jgi:hypothetical protein
LGATEPELGSRLAASEAATAEERPIPLTRGPQPRHEDKGGTLGVNDMVGEARTGRLGAKKIGGGRGGAARHGASVRGTGKQRRQRRGLDDDPAYARQRRQRAR